MGIVRDKPTTDKRVAEELSGRSNITILEADLTKYDAVKVRIEPCYSTFQAMCVCVLFKNFHR